MSAENNEEPPRYSWQWWWEAPRSDEGILPIKPGLGCAISALVLITISWFGCVVDKHSYYADRFSETNAYGATANSVESIEKKIDQFSPSLLFRPADFLIAGLLYLAIWKLGEIYYLLEKRLK